MSTKLRLLVGTMALVTVADFKNLVGDEVTSPAGSPMFNPADPTIVSVTTGPGRYVFVFTAGALGKTTVPFTHGDFTIPDAIEVEVIAASTPTSADFTIGEVTPVPASEPQTAQLTEPPVANATAQEGAQPTGM